MDESLVFRVNAAATCVQRFGRAMQARKIRKQLQEEMDEEISGIMSSGISIGGRRVEPWSEESAKMALREYGGKISDTGMTVWPKGTVERLLMERTKYMDAYKKERVKAMRKARAQLAARDMVERTVATVMKSLTEEQAGKDETVESKWTVEEWLDSLKLTTIISNSLCEELRKKSNDPRFERGIISLLGQISIEDGHTIVAELLESCLPRIAGKVVEESKVVYQELLEEQRGDKEEKVGGKFFDDAGAGQGRTFVLNFGDRNDFFGGLEKLVGPMDPISVRARMTKEHTKGPDAKASFEVGNYGTVTTSTYEWWFVVEPTPQKMAHLGLKTWPQESKLLKDKKSRSQMRKPLHPDTFRDKKEEINERLKPMNQYLTSDLFIAARLYTGPMFVKCAYARALLHPRLRCASLMTWRGSRTPRCTPHARTSLEPEGKNLVVTMRSCIIFCHTDNGVLRAATGQPFFISCRDKLCLGNMYSTTLHTINNAITTLSGLSPSCNVYRGVSGGMLPEKFLAPDAQDNFRGGVELGFMSTTTNREIAYFYARGSNGLVFQIFMGLVDKGMSPSLARCSGASKGVALDYPLSAMRLSYRTSRQAAAAALDSRHILAGADLSVFSQYPHEAEFCFPPLTALEVRGIKVEGSTTVVEVDARVCMTQAKASEDDLDKIKTFREIDTDDTGELSLKEFKKLARQLIPDAADKTLEQIFRESDRDKTGSIDFEEYKEICVSKLKEEEEKVRAWRARPCPLSRLYTQVSTKLPLCLRPPTMGFSPWPYRALASLLL